MSKNQRSFFDERARQDRLVELGDPLFTLNSVIDWEMFRPILETAISRSSRKKGGRPPFDVVLMFKILILQRLYNLSDDRLEYQITDRLSFMRFLGLQINDKVPDAKTIWKFRNDLAQHNADRDLFDVFDGFLRKKGLITNRGSILDATIVESPRQRTTNDEYSQIREGEIPPAWKSPKKKNSLAQRDLDARWAYKNDERHYGYKDHVKGDQDSKLITNYTVSPASDHDSQHCLELLDERDVALYADSAYTGEPIATGLPPRCKNQISERGKRNAPLTKKQIKSNRRKAKIRSRVEHIFALIKSFLNGGRLRCIGIIRAKFDIGLMNLLYNMRRYQYLICHE